MSEKKPQASQSQRPAQGPPAAPPRKLGEGLVRDMAARGASELAHGFGMHGHDYGRTVHDRPR